MILLDYPESFISSQDSTEYTLTGSFHMDSGEKFEIERQMSFTGPAEVYTPDFTACKGDTVILPITYHNITKEMQLQFFDLDVLLNEGLKVIGIKEGNAKNVNSQMRVKTLETNLEDSRAFQLTTWEYYIHRNQPSDFHNKWHLNYYSNNDTIAFVKVKVLKDGEYTLMIEPLVFDYYDNMPHNDRQGTLTALQPEGEATSITSTKVKGLHNIVRLDNEPASSNLNYTWSYNNTEAYESSTYVDVRSSDQTVQLSIEDQHGCIASFEHIVLTENEDLYSISGVLRDENNNALTGEVIAYQLIDGAYYPAGKDETNTDGTYKVENLIAGEYILMGVPNNQTYNAAYYYLEGLRTNANQLSVISDIVDVDLVLPEKENIDGNLLEGIFIKDSITISYENAFQTFHGTLPNIVFLTNENNEIINTTTLGTNGNYSIMSDENHTKLTASYGLISELLKENFLIQSTEKEAMLNLNIYPNPFSSYLQMTLDEAAHIKIYNMKGIMLKEELGDKGINTLHTDDLKPGFYIISITGNNSTTKIGLTKQ